MNEETESNDIDDIKHNKQVVKEKIINILKSPSGIVSSVLTFIIAVLIGFNIYFNPVKLSDYTTGLVTEFFGIIVTVIFVQVLFDRKSIKDAQRDEIDAIKRADKVMQLYIEEYVSDFYNVSTPLANRTGSVCMPERFELSDMCDLFLMSLNINSRMYTRCIDLFDAIELTLRNYIIELLVNIDFKYNKNLEELLLEFVKISATYDMREAIKSSSEIITSSSEKKYEGQKFSVLISDMLRNEGNEFYKRFDTDEKNVSHPLAPYVFIYIKMNKERDLINEYQNIIKAI